MISYRQYNANPKNRKTGDCTTRALSIVLGISWEDALKLQYECAIKTKYGPFNKETLDRIMTEHGWVKMKQPRKENNKKYLVGEIDQITYPTERKEGILILIANHCTVVRNDNLFDIWDCRYKTIGNYWIKPFAKNRR